MPIVRVFIIMLFAFLPARFGYADDVVLAFEDYPVALIGFDAAEAVDFDSHEDAWSFRTRLRDGLKADANYAQKYVVVTFGCGTSCQMNWVLNKENGRVLDVFSSTFGSEYKIDSTLLIVDPLPLREGEVTGEGYLEGVRYYESMVGGPRYYSAENDEFKLILDNSREANL